MLSLETTSSLSPYLWGALAVSVALLLDVLFRAPSNLHRPDAKIQSYRTLFAGLGPTALFEKRNTFLRSVFGHPEKFATSPPPSSAARFNARNHVLTVSANPEDRKTFFHDRSLDFEKGYETLFAGIPDVPEWLKGVKDEEKQSRLGDAAVEETGMGSFNYNLKNALSTDRIDKSVATMVGYSLDAFRALPASGGRIWCHDTIYSLIFRLSLVGVGLNEQHRDLDAMQRIEKPFWSFADNAGYLQTLFPLLFTPSTVRKWKGTIAMATNVSQLVEARRKSGSREDDYPQVLIDRGVPTKQIVEFVMGSLFAAIINTTGVTSYTLIFMAAYPECQRQLRDELETVLRAEAEGRGDDYDALSVEERLARVPLAVWEDAERFPYQQAVERETMRLLLNSLLFRRKLDKRGVKPRTTTLSGDVVTHQEFVGYWLSSVHYNESIYSDPLLFDPDRWMRGEGRGDGDFLAWGWGNHPCLGMRFAKLEIKIALAAFLESFPHVRAVNDRGEEYDRTSVPKPVIDSEHRRLPQKPVFLAYDDNRLRAQPTPTAA
ncbi:uncharacterized protein PFL1_06856 [Pseudozyma flocculosa PF-1]|uniref:Cytochrome P450 n=2 Tax=Pseudozyma flocculosa TaxID=84751 RepID=A0A5C3F0E8_9BASI|nr:uncharacterized protein PFL1_06856 [Pseudozyma flocculosa PF-1]EPQ29861.1 hypothetical protein PFL1_06856 [Pseudozyma flocculosa PF-1]SPO37157.1 uncharacterized protein PSFLO_02629 [Pseudozyma flocculosa]